MKGQSRLGRIRRNGDTAALSEIIALGADNVVPTEFRIFKAGLNTSDKGDFLFDDKAAAAVMAAFAKKNAPLTMDYEHQVLADPPVEAPASASEWMPEIRNGELWATNVKWTPRAREYLANREYTRFSPLFFHEPTDDPKTKRVTRIVNVALTNTPALDGIEPLVAASAIPEEITMKKLACTSCKTGLKAPTDDADGDEMYCSACRTAAKMLSAVGLRTDVSDQAAVTALTELNGFRATVIALTGKSTPAEALGVVSAWKSNDAEIVRLRGEVDRVETERLTAEFTGLLDGATREGKLPPNGPARGNLEALALRGGKITKEAIELVRADLSTRIPLVTPEGGGKKELATAASLITEDDKKMAAALGTDLKALAEYKAAVAAAR